MTTFFKQLGWAGAIGLFFGSFGLLMFLGASYHWLATGEYTPGVIVLGLSVLICYSVWTGLLQPAVLATQLTAHGEPAKATILSLTENGMMVRTTGTPRAGIKLEVEVRPANGNAPYKATMKLFVSMFEVARFQPGQTIDVMYDRRNPQKVGVRNS